jgi:hypothetical protein
MNPLRNRWVARAVVIAFGLSSLALVACHARLSGQSESYWVDPDDSKLKQPWDSDAPKPFAGNTVGEQDRMYQRTSMIGDHGDFIRYVDDSFALVVNSMYLAPQPAVVTIGRTDVVVFCETWLNAADTSAEPLNQIVYIGANQLIPSRLNFENHLAFGPAYFQGSPVKIRFTVMLQKSKDGGIPFLDVPGEATSDRSLIEIIESISKATQAGQLASEAVALAREVLRSLPDVVVFDYEFTGFSVNPESLRGGMDFVASAVVGEMAVLEQAVPRNVPVDELEDELNLVNLDHERRIFADLRSAQASTELPTVEKFVNLAGGFADKMSAGAKTILAIRTDLETLEQQTIVARTNELQTAIGIGTSAADFETAIRKGTTLPETAQGRPRFNAGASNLALYMNENVTQLMIDAAVGEAWLKMSPRPLKSEGKATLNDVWDQWDTAQTHPKLTAVADKLVLRRNDLTTLQNTLDEAKRSIISVRENLNGLVQTPENQPPAFKEAPLPSIGNSLRGIRDDADTAARSLESTARGEPIIKDISDKAGEIRLAIDGLSKDFNDELQRLKDARETLSERIRQAGATGNTSGEPGRDAMNPRGWWVYRGDTNWNEKAPWLRWGTYALVETQRRGEIPAFAVDVCDNATFNGGWLYLPDQAHANQRLLGRSWLLFTILPGQSAESRDVLERSSRYAGEIIARLRSSNANAAAQGQNLQNLAVDLSEATFLDALSNRIAREASEWTQRIRDGQLGDYTDLQGQWVARLNSIRDDAVNSETYGNLKNRQGFNRKFAASWAEIQNRWLDKFDAVWRFHHGRIAPPAAQPQTREQGAVPATAGDAH